MIELRVPPDLEGTPLITAIALIALRHPGDHELTLLAGQRRLTLGPDWRYDGSPVCMAALGEFGAVVRAD